MTCNWSLSDRSKFCQTLKKLLWPRFRITMFGFPVWSHDCIMIAWPLIAICSILWKCDCKLQHFFPETGVHFWFPPKSPMSIMGSLNDCCICLTTTTKRVRKTRRSHLVTCFTMVMTYNQNCGLNCSCKSRVSCTQYFHSNAFSDAFDPNA